MSETKGRVTIPTDLDVIPETLKMLDEWGADAIRDCDGTEFPAGTEENRRQRFMQLIIPPERIMPGQRPIRKKSSRCIS